MKILNIDILFMFIYTLDQNIFWLIDKIILYHTYFRVEALPVYKYNSTCFSICNGRYCPRSNHWPSLRGWCDDIGQYFWCRLKKQLLLYLLPWYVKNVPNRNFIKSHATLQWFHFAVVSLCNGTISICSIDVAFEEAVRVNMKKDVHFRYRFSRSPLFTNKATISLYNGLYREISPVVKDF